jgi:hypothetical protein
MIENCPKILKISERPATAKNRKFMKAVECGNHDQKSWVCCENDVLSPLNPSEGNMAFVF